MSLREQWKIEEYLLDIVQEFIIETLFLKFLNDKLNKFYNQRHYQGVNSNGFGKGNGNNHGNLDSFRIFRIARHAY